MKNHFYEVSEFWPKNRTFKTLRADHEEVNEAEDEPGDDVPFRDQSVLMKDARV